MSKLDPSKTLSSDQVRVIVASSLGSVFEWYDFYLYATLASNIAHQFFSSLPPGPAFICALLIMASGLAIRPFGAMVFGYFGDKTGRKSSFLATIIVMGVSTFLVGLLPTYKQIGMAAPIILIFLRCLQGLAVGGEYGGAAAYVAEHSPPEKRGFFTGFLQSTPSVGLLTCVLVIIFCQLTIGGKEFENWGWRIPFLLSGVILVISIYIRTRLHESPVFKQMKLDGQTTKSPIKDSFTNWTNLQTVFTVLFGAVAGQAAVAYSSHVYAFYFLTQILKIDTLTGNCLLAISFAFCTLATIFFGWLSDKIGRKPQVMVGFLLYSIILFPTYKGFTHFGNPALEKAMIDYPARVIADPSQCSLQFVPSELKKHIKFNNPCDVLRNLLNQYSVSYTTVDGPPGSSVMVMIGNQTISCADVRNLTNVDSQRAQQNFTISIISAIQNAGYPTHANREEINIPMLVLIWTALSSIKAMTYGSLAAWMVELFPTKIRYTSLSLPYHVGNGWVGGFLPSVAFSIVLLTGDIYAGLWYPVLLILMTFVVGMACLNETKNVDISKINESTYNTMPITRCMRFVKKYLQKILT